MAIIFVNQDTFEVKVQCGPGEGFLPSEQSIAIQKTAELIAATLQKFLKEQHEPAVKKLLQMCSEFNYKYSPAYRAKIDAANKAKLPPVIAPIPPPSTKPTPFKPFKGPKKPPKKHKKSSRK
jgi:hypothetical protein